MTRSRFSFVGRSRVARAGVSLVVAAALGTVMILAAAAPAGAQSSGGTLAIVLKTKNDVSQRPDAQSEWKPATKGQVLGVGHQLRTGADGFCAIMFRDDKSLIKMNASTEIKLEGEPVAGGKFSKKLWVGVGGVWAQVAKQQGTEFVVETPTSVASVKGTQGYDIVDESGYSTLYGLDGTWDFSNPFGAVLVNPGFQAYSNGIDPPALTQTPPGQAPDWSSKESIPGLENPQGGGGEGGDVDELRLGLEDADGTHRTLVIRYREPKPAEPAGGTGGE